jgi:hypothetical protein
VKNVPIDAIRKLASLVIKQNVFSYEKKFYKQIFGGIKRSAFTLTLANIKLTRQIGRSLPFLSVFIRDKCGILTTSILSNVSLNSYYFIIDTISI